MNEPTVTIIGNVAGDPELRFTSSGVAVANFRILSTPRQFDRQSNEWKDGETLGLNCSVWREAAENVAETLQKGMRVIAQGRLKSRSFDTKEGDRRTVMELDVDEIGPSLRFASATVQRQSRGGGPGGGQPSGGFNQGGQGGGRQQAAPQNDPWSQQGQSGQGRYDWGPGQDNEPPF